MSMTNKPIIVIWHRWKNRWMSRSRCAWKSWCLGETRYCSTKGFHMVMRLSWASRALSSFYQGNSRKSTTHQHRQRKMIMAVAPPDWQLLQFLQLHRPLHGYQDTGNMRKKTALKKSDNLFSPSPPSPETGEKAMHSQWYIYSCI